MSLTFYDCLTAPSPRRARILLALKQVPHDVVEVDLRSGERERLARYDTLSNSIQPTIDVANERLLFSRTIRTGSDLTLVNAIAGR